MDELSITPAAITVAHLRLALDLSVPKSYELADLLGAFTLPGAKRGKLVLLSRIREHFGDAVADDIAATMTRTLPASASPVTTETLPTNVVGSSELQQLEGEAGAAAVGEPQDGDPPD